jgi:hypothetical protein
LAPRYIPTRQFSSTLRSVEPLRRRGGTAVQRPAASAAPVVEPDADEAADLYFRKGSRGLQYLHFANAKTAIAYVRDNLTRQQQGVAVLQVGERRFEGDEVLAMVAKAEREKGQARRGSEAVA